MRSPQRMLVAVERALPQLTRCEWGELAIAAARRAGLEGDDIFRLSLAIHTRNNELAADVARKRRAR